MRKCSPYIMNADGSRMGESGFTHTSRAFHAGFRSDRYNPDGVSEIMKNGSDHAIWRVELLGGVRTINGSQVVSHFESRKAVSLLAYLAYYRDRMHPREVLAEMLWPDEDPMATRDRLRQALAALRRLLEPDGVSPRSVLQADRSEVGLSPEMIGT